jgi:hypothetical protein
MQLTFSPTIVLLLLPFITGSLAQDGDKDSGAAPIDPKVSSYLAHLSADPKYSSVAAVVSTAVSGTRAQSRILNGELSKLTTRTWYSTLPSDIQAYASSVDSEKAKLGAASATATGSGPAATGTAARSSDKGAASSASSKASAPAPTSAAASPAASASPAKNGGERVQRGMGMGLAAAGVLGMMAL